MLTFTGAIATEEEHKKLGNDFYQNYEAQLNSSYPVGNPFLYAIFLLHEKNKLPIQDEAKINEAINPLARLITDLLNPLHKGHAELHRTVSLIGSKEIPEGEILAQLTKQLADITIGIRSLAVMFGLPLTDATFICANAHHTVEKSDSLWTSPEVALEHIRLLLSTQSV